MKQKSLTFDYFHYTQRALLGTDKYPVKLRVYYKAAGTIKGDRTYLSIKNEKNEVIYLTKSEFERIRKGNVKDKRLQEIKMFLHNYISYAETIGNEIKDFTIEEFKRKFYGINDSILKNEFLFDMFDKCYNDKINKGDVSTASSYKTTCNSLRKFQNKIEFTEIDKEFLNRYEFYLLSKGASINTIGIYMRNLRAILNQAILKGYIKSENYPFSKNGYTIKTRKKSKYSLTKAELLAFKSVKVEESSNYDKARDFWLISFLANGMNLKDILNLRYKDISDNTIRFIRAKTENSKNSNQEEISVSITNKLQTLINKWSAEKINENTLVFDILKDNISPQVERDLIQNFNKVINKYLNRIAIEAGIIDKKVTFYLARHTYATQMINVNAPIELLRQKMGHSSQKTTQIYIGTISKETDNHYANIISELVQ